MVEQVFLSGQLPVYSQRADKKRGLPGAGLPGQKAVRFKRFGPLDQVLYEIDVSKKSKPFTVSAELLYQTLSNAFARDLFQDHTEQENRFATYYADLDKKPVIVANTNKTVP